MPKSKVGQTGKQTGGGSGRQSSAGGARGARPAPKQTANNTRAKEVYDEPVVRKTKKEHKLLKSIVPYLLILIALVLAICFFTVRVLGLEDGAGVVGYYIQLILCGLFGGAAMLLPFVLVYIGIKWCLYNIKLKEHGDDAEYEEELTALRKRNVLQTVMASLLVLFIGMLVGVIADRYDGFEIGEMWIDAAEDMIGGGVVGGLPAVLMVMAFETVISTVILIVLIALAVILVIGLTPDRIVVYFRNRSIRKKEEKKALAAERRRIEAERAKEEKQHKIRISVPARREEKWTEDEEDESFDGDSFVDVPEPEEEPPQKPSKRKTQADERDIANEILSESESDGDEDEIYIGPSRDSAAASGSIEVKAESSSGKADEFDDIIADAMAGEDFGGDPVFDNPSFNDMSAVLGGLKSSDDAEVPDDAAPKEDIEMSEIGSDELMSDAAAVAPDDEEEVIEVETPYVFPPMDILEKNKNPQNTDFSEELQDNARKLMETLKSFKVSIKEITYSRGPTITRYELKPDAGTRVRAIANLVDDIALNLATSGVRIEAPIPNKPAVGIEVPNRERATVYLRDLIDSPKFDDAKSKLTSSLGMDVGGNPIYFDIAKMPHLLIAGATGMGKSVCINSVIVSLLYKAKPDEVKLILIDPKKVEFNIYKDIPHLYAPIVSDPKKAAGALASAVAEMERRFELIEEVGVRDIATYNAVTENDPDKEFMPQMVIIIDELADLMMTAPDEVESSICRLAQKARAAGIHIIIGTQRPSVDVITGLIKANIPSRIACTVASQIDSRTILDIAGAEKLIGRGDMLFAPVGASKPMRVQGAYVSEAEVEKIVTFIKENNTKAKYNEEFILRTDEEAMNLKSGLGKKSASASAGAGDSDGAAEGGDSKFRDAVKLAIEEGKISTSLMQRRLGLGYGRAAKIIDSMEEMGYVSKPDGNKPRRVLITMDEYMRRLENNDLGTEED